MKACLRPQGWHIYHGDSETDVMRKQESLMKPDTR